MCKEVHDRFVGFYFRRKGGGEERECFVSQPHPSSFFFHLFSFFPSSFSFHLPRLLLLPESAAPGALQCKPPFRAFSLFVRGKKEREETTGLVFHPSALYLSVELSDSSQTE